MTENYSKEQQQRHNITLLVDNEFGVLARMVSIFSARGYNIESLSVSVVDYEKNLSRMNIVINCTKTQLDLILLLLERAVPVHEVCHLNYDDDYTERSILLASVYYTSEEEKLSLEKLCQQEEISLLSTSDKSMVIEILNSADKVNNILSKLKSYKIKFVAKSGAITIRTQND